MVIVDYSLNSTCASTLSDLSFKLYVFLIDDEERDFAINSSLFAM